MVPELSLEATSELVGERYGIKGTIKKLGGYSDLNYLIKDGSQPPKKYVFKISSNEEHETLIRIQSYVLSKIEALGLKYKLGFPEIVRSLKGEDIILIEGQDRRNLARLFKFVEGRELWQLQTPSEQIITGTGIVTAQLSLFLAEMSQHEPIKALIEQMDMEKYRQNILFFIESYKKDAQFLDQDVLEEVRRTMEDFLKILPSLRQLPLQLIHNDICLSNLLVDKRGGEYCLSGVIDFSAMVNSYSVVELAILAARINMDKSRPLKNLMLVVRGFNSVRKLEAVEQKLLFVLIRARLSFLTLMLCRDCHQSPDNEYLRKNKESIVEYIKTFSSIPPEEFQKELEQQLK